ncbi:MAG: hypothetical protein RBT80_27740 [Candidatus Vecturithrix sp.]|jgi:hypothetical protein|nr:hypothetical protein [Candidatus Vecturithrix sp.]
MKLYYDKSPCNGLANALPFYGDKEFQLPTRSTLPLLSLIKDEQQMLSELFHSVGMSAEWTLHLEYKVNPPRGIGKASHTDLMVLSNTSSLAIEAKWTEPRYQTVGEWLREGTNPSNRLDVFSGWLSLLQKHARRQLKTEDFTDTVYQMVHRSASACAVAADPRMAYLVFKSSLDPKTADFSTIQDDIKHLWNLLGKPKSFPFYLIEMYLLPTSAFNAIVSMAKGNNSTARQVSAALLGADRLFRFKMHRLINVGESL